jgi:formylmethanofuran dehydrogenase subunit C
MALSLAYHADTTLPVEVEGITPDVTANKSAAEIGRLLIYRGNEQLALGELFSVSGDASDGVLRWAGNLAGVHWIGAKMTRGQIHVAGPAGRHVGSEMEGGEIFVDGDAGDWAGGEMHGGLLRIHGHAGHLVGAAYRGSPRGMTGGTILIHGNAGNEIGHTMRRGLIAIAGQAGDLAGFNMLAGSVLLFGASGIRHGAGMRRGTIGLFGDPRPELLSSFRYACRYRPDFLALMFVHLRHHGFPVAEALAQAEFELFHGDLLEGGRGEILVKAPDNRA